MQFKRSKVIDLKYELETWISMRNFAHIFITETASANDIISSY